MRKRCVVYIDGANLYKGVTSLGWQLDYQKFFVWLTEKYRAESVFIFIGFVPENQRLYKALQRIGYTLVQKEVTYDEHGKPKGNCDTDLVQQVLCDHYEGRCARAIIVSNDGDYAGLVGFLKDRDALECVISPSDKCSFLLRKLDVSIVFLSTQENHLHL